MVSVRLENTIQAELVVWIAQSLVFVVIRLLCRRYGEHEPYAEPYYDHPHHERGSSCMILHELGKG